MWDAHIHAVVRCFVAWGPAFCEGELERAMFYATYATTLTQEHLIKLHTNFDTAEWHNIKSAPSHHSNPDYCNDDMECRRRIITVLPHLIGLVRQFVRTPNDEHVGAKVTSLLTELLALDSIHGPSTKPPGTASMPLAETDILPSILLYSDPNDIFSYSYQWSLRIAIYGLCRRMQSCSFPIPTAPRLDELYREMHQCALLICMTLPHLSTSNERIAGGSLFPMQMAWTGLWIVESKNEDKSSVDRLLEWLEKCVARTAKFVGRDHTRQALINYADTLQGGPLNSTTGPYPLNVS